MTTLSRLYLTLVLTAVAMPVFAQGVARGFVPSGRRFHIDDRWIVSGPQEPETEYLANEKKVRGGVFDQRAETILKAAQSYTESVFTFSSLEVRKTATYAQRFWGKDECGTNSDSLMVEWAVNGQAGAGTLILADDMMLSTYTLRIPRAAIHSIDDLTTFLTGILVPAKPPLHLVLTNIDFAVPPPPGIAAFMGMTFWSASPFINDVLIHGSVREGYCYLLVQVGKGLTRDIYPVPPFIPERFPPLADQARDWSFDRIRSEVGKEGCVDERDHVLLTELAKRGLSQEQFVDLLVNTGTTDPQEIWMRAKTTTRALWEAGKGELLERYMEPALEAYSRMGPTGEGFGAELFSAARARCSPVFEALAVKHVKGPYPEGPLFYLDACSTSRDTLEVLEGLQLPSSLAESRAQTIRSIRQRIEKAGGK